MTKTAISQARHVRACLLLLATLSALPAQIEDHNETAEEFDEGPATYVLPFIEEVHKQSYADFRKYCRERKWSRAFRSIGKQLDVPPEGLMPGSGPVFQTWQDQMRTDLAALPADGRRAFRLFYDAKGRKLLAAAAALPEGERPARWRHIASSYFITAAGDDAACLLAANAMERNRPREASVLLRAVIDHHPDTDRDRLTIWMDYARSLAAARLPKALEEASDYILGRYEGQTTRHEGTDQKIEDVVAGLTKLAASSARTTAGQIERLELPETLEVAWQKNLTKLKNSTGRVREIFTGRQPQQSATQTVPVARLIADRLWLNNNGQVIVIDPETGDKIVRKGSPGQANAWQPLPRAVLVPLPNDRVLTSGSPVSVARRHNQAQRLPLSCWDATRHEVLWKTRSRQETKEFGFLGDPVYDDGTVIAVAHKGSSRQLYLLGLAPEDGALKWEVDIGTPAGRSASMGWGGATVPDLPVVIPDGSWIYIMGDGGAVVAVDRDAKAIGWAMRHELTASSPWYNRGVPPSPGSVVFVNGVLYFRAASSRMLHALDVRRRQLRWRPRPVNPHTAIVAADDELLYLLGEQLSAWRLRDGSQVWARDINCGGVHRQIVVGKDHVYALSRRGLFEFRKLHGGVARPPLRHSKAGPNPLGTTGGDLLLQGDRLICVAGDSVCRIDLGKKTADEPKDKKQNDKE